MLLHRWSIMWLCLCVSAAEEVAVWQEPGQNVTFRCCTAGCNRSMDSFSGLYLYHEFTSNEEVLYYHSDPGPERITPRIRYQGRVQIEGSLLNHTITISNLTVDDSGLYRCVYTKTAAIKACCSVYTLIVKEPPVRPPTPEQCPPLLLFIIATFVTSALLTMVFTVMIILRVKPWTSKKRRRGNVPPGSSSDCVYEVMLVMTKDGLRPLAPPQ